MPTQNQHLLQLIFVMKRSRIFRHCRLRCTGNKQQHTYKINIFLINPPP